MALDVVNTLASDYITDQMLVTTDVCKQEPIRGRSVQRDLTKRKLRRALRAARCDDVG